MTKYKSYRIIDEKPRLVIIDETGKVVDRNPSKEELKVLVTLPKETDADRNKQKYTDEQLLWYPMQFYEKYGRSPTARDFVNIQGYPNVATYYSRFGSFQKALKLVGLDIDTMVKNGKLETNQQKARLAEIKVRNHFKQYSVDLAGKNCNSPWDGICPNGMNYDVKSSKLTKYNGAQYYHFQIDNKYKDDIEIFYLLAFNKDYTKLDYAWRVPGEIIEENSFYIGMKRAKFNIENMKEYNITDKIKDIIL